MWHVGNPVLRIPKYQDNNGNGKDGTHILIYPVRLNSLKAWIGVKFNMLQV
jgi:hypothetical protein